jgi:hypothetical protein
VPKRAGDFLLTLIAGALASFALELLFVERAGARPSTSENAAVTADAFYAQF